MAAPPRTPPDSGAQWRALELQLLGLLVQRLGDGAAPEPLLQALLQQLDGQGRRTLDDDLALLRALAALARRPARQPAGAPALVRPYLPAHSHGLEELERVLAQHGGRQTQAARALGLTPRQFGYRLRKARAG